MSDDRQHGVAAQEDAAEVRVQEVAVRVPGRLQHEEVEVLPELAPHDVHVPRHDLAADRRVGVVAPRHGLPARVGARQHWGGGIGHHGFGRPPDHGAGGRDLGVVGPRLGPVGVVLAEQRGGAAHDEEEVLGEHLLLLGELDQRRHVHREVGGQEGAHAQQGGAHRRQPAQPTRPRLTRPRLTRPRVVIGRLLLDTARARVDRLPLAPLVGWGAARVQDGQQLVAGREELVCESGCVPRALVGQDPQHSGKRDGLDRVAQPPRVVGECRVDAVTRVARRQGGAGREEDAGRERDLAVDVGRAHARHDRVEVLKPARHAPHHLGTQLLDVAVGEHREAHRYQPLQQPDGLVAELGQRTLDVLHLQTQPAETGLQPLAGVHALLEHVPVVDVHAQVLAECVQAEQLADGRVRGVAALDGVRRPVLLAEHDLQVGHVGRGRAHAEQTVAHELEPGVALQHPPQPAVVLAEGGGGVGVYEVRPPVLGVLPAGMAPRVHDLEGASQQLDGVLGIAHAERRPGIAVPVPVRLVPVHLAGREMFYLMMHSTHFIYGYMVSDMWLRTILIVREETRCRHIGVISRSSQCSTTGVTKDVEGNVLFNDALNTFYFTVIWHQTCG